MAEVEEQFQNFEEQPAAEEPETYEEEAVDDALAYANAAELPEIKLFGRWSCDDVNVSDMSLAVSFQSLHSFREFTHSPIQNPNHISNDCSALVCAFE